MMIKFRRRKMKGNSDTKQILLRNVQEKGADAAKGDRDRKILLGFFLKKAISSVNERGKKAVRNDKLQAEAKMKMHCP